LGRGIVVGALSELLALLASRATSPVRRAERRLAMATASKKPRASKRLAERAHVDARAATEFRIFEDNSGSYHWTILARDGSTLGGSGDYGSYDDAERAAHEIRDGAASARLEARGSGTGAVDLGAKHDGTDERALAEHRLQEGRSSNGEAVAQWPAQH
jgi:uncharacterized protein YegP (UPF0339 family)